MELTGELKEKVEKTETVDDAKKIIKDSAEKAGLILNDEELDGINGGTNNSVIRKYGKNIVNHIPGGVNESQNTVVNQTSNAGNKNNAKTGVIYRDK